MNFREWLENYEYDDGYGGEYDDDWGEVDLDDMFDVKSDDMFDRRDKNQGIDFNLVLQSLGLPPINNKQSLAEVGQGSFANVYINPHDNTKVIKITGDDTDARNFERIVKRGFKHRCVVNCYNVAKINETAWAMVLDYVSGEKIKYDTMLHQLIMGDNNESVEQAKETILDSASVRPDKTRSEVFKKLGMRVTRNERQKLSRLFDAIYSLKMTLGIEMVDFSENIIDTVTDYVIIDLGQ